VVNNDFWVNVKNLLKENNTYQDWVANKCGVKPRTFQNWIYRNIPPNVIDGQKIAEALETTVEYLVTGKPPADMPETIMAIIKEAKKLNDEGKRAALGAIQGLQVLYPQKEEEKTVYADTQPISYVTKDPEPAYPQPLKVQKNPKIDNNVAAFVPTYYIPFYGKAAAGRPIDIDIPPDRVIPVPAPVLRGDKSRYFSVEVKGTSMTKAGINDGDYVIIRRAEEPESGKVMLVRCGDESTVKRIKMKEGKVLLCWEDGSGKAIEVDSSEYEIQGEFVKVLRDLD
jgi:SOS-response transcriptional repressor LexA